MSKDLVEDSKILANVNTRGKKSAMLRKSYIDKCMMCSHYGKGGHIVELCYKKHGYPLGFKARPKEQKL